MQKRWRIILIIVAIVLAFIISSGVSREAPATGEIVQPAPHAQRQSTTAVANDESIENVQLRKIERKASVKASAEVFKPKSWYVPPPPPPPAPPPAPTAPPLPFQLLGKVVNPDGTFTIFLSNQNRVFLVKGGETIDGMYRVDGITDKQLVLTYLPLQMQQYLNLGDTP